MSHGPPVAWRVRQALQPHVAFDLDVLATMERWCDEQPAETAFEVLLRTDLAAVRLLAPGSQAESRQETPGQFATWLQLEPGHSRVGNACSTEAAQTHARRLAEGVDLGPLAYLLEAELVTAVSWSVARGRHIQLTARPAGLGARVEIDNILPAWRLLGLDVPDVRVLAAIAAHSGSLRILVGVLGDRITSLAWSVLEPDERTVYLIVGAQPNVDLAALTAAQTTLAQREVRALHVGADRNGLYTALDLSIA